MVFADIVFRRLQRKKIVAPVSRTTIRSKRRKRFVTLFRFLFSYLFKDE